MYRPIVQFGMRLKVRINHLAYRRGPIWGGCQTSFHGEGLERRRLRRRTGELLQTGFVTSLIQPVDEFGHLGGLAGAVQPLKNDECSSGHVSTRISKSQREWKSINSSARRVVPASDTTTGIVNLTEPRP
jgi:hypothetical protein